MRLIDADALMERLQRVYEMMKMASTQTYADAISNAMIGVKTAPTVDAIEVVRCKNCKHWGTGYGGETESIKVCEYANYMVGKNGYCVYGEREDGSGGAG